MSDQSFKEAFAEILEISLELLTDDFNMEYGAVWDSLAFISTIALIDRYYNIVIDADVLKNVQTFGDIQSLLFKKVA